MSSREKKKEEIYVQYILKYKFHCFFCHFVDIFFIFFCSTFAIACVFECICLSHYLETKRNEGKNCVVFFARCTAQNSMRCNKYDRIIIISHICMCTSVAAVAAFQLCICVIFYIFST